MWVAPLGIAPCTFPSSIIIQISARRAAIGKKRRCTTD